MLFPAFCFFRCHVVTLSHLIVKVLKKFYCCPVKVLHGKKIRLKPSCRIPASFVTLLVAKKTVVT